MRPTPEDRFWAKVDKDGPNGCWLWTCGADRYGYGRLKVNGKFVGAHRFAYELLVGPIPQGLTIDHLCRVRNCVNPSHLEPVTMIENYLRGNSFAAINGRKTHCKHGHEFTPENTQVCPSRPTARHCRACTTERSRQRRQRIKESS